MTIQLRYYQEDAKQRIFNNIEAGCKKQLLEMPTASGKTYMSAFTIKEIVKKGLKVFFIVADTALVMQTYKAFSNIGLNPSVVKSGSGMDKYFNKDANIQIIMAQTYNARLNILDDLHTDVIFIDEVHFMYTGSIMKNILSKHENAFIIGITATPIDEKGYLLKGFDKYELDIISIQELQRQKMVAIDRYFPATPMDITGVRVKNTGEFNDKDLDEKCNQSYIIDDIVKNYLKYNEGHKAICYAINIDHGEKLQKAFLNAGIPTGLIHSKMKKYQVDYFMTAHKEGRIKLLINVSCLIRGYDDINIIDMIDCQPTNSLRKQIQKWGRVCRMDNLGIGYARIFDFAGNYDRFLAWSMSRIYSLDKTAYVKPEFESIVCPNCFEAITVKSNSCPTCGFILTAKIEAKQREIKENLRIQEVKEVIALTGAEGAIKALTNLLGKNGNTFYYTKLLAFKPPHINTDAFNGEIIRLANYARRQGYNPFYVVNKIKEKIS